MTGKGYRRLSRRYLRVAGGRVIRMVPTDGGDLRGEDHAGIVGFLIETGIFPPDSPMSDDAGESDDEGAR